MTKPKAKTQSQDKPTGGDEKPPAFLGVEESATHRLWLGPTNAQMRKSSQMTQIADIPDLLARILARLGVEPNDATAYLSPRLADLMPDPSTLLDMDKVAERINKAVQDNQRIAIFADYDVDGACSAALLMLWLKQLGLEATPYIPDRIKEGYGPNNPAMQHLCQDHDLIICVDCGTMAHAAFEGISCDIIVLDHHQGGEILPPCFGVVNPNRQDEVSELTYLCAAGVVFMTLIALNRLRAKMGETCPDLIEMLDLVGLATVADVVPLVGLNRAFVRQGLKIMAGRRRIGLVALMDTINLFGAPTTSDLGFGVGPCLNAGGRVGKADLALELLCCEDPELAKIYAEQLAVLNKERREIEAIITDLARAQAVERAKTIGTNAPLVWAAEEGWHSGVLGIVAARIKESSNRPSVVIGFDGDIGKGSGRSLAGIDIGAAVATCVREGLLMSGGGHKMAAGLSLHRDNLDPAMARLSDLLAAQGAGEIGPANLYLDGVARVNAIDAELIDQLEQAGPYGSAVAGPRFAFAGMRVAYYKPVGDTHLQLRFADEDKAQIAAIAFRAFDGPLGDMLMNHGGAAFHIAGRLVVDTWRGKRTVKLRLEDVFRCE